MQRSQPLKASLEETATLVRKFCLREREVVGKPTFTRMLAQFEVPAWGKLQSMSKSLLLVAAIVAPHLSEFHQSRNASYNKKGLLRELLGPPPYQRQAKH